jgi:hypothetical protein
VAEVERLPPLRPLIYAALSPGSFMLRLTLFLLPLAAGCGSSWGLRDEDGDGRTILEGDCFDAPDGGGDVGPGAAEIWYDGIDQNCDGASDYDKDGDGFESVAHGGVDCWDDPDVVPEGFDALNGFPALTAASVFPDSTDISYDGIDANCDGLSDFDDDGDGFDTSNTDHRQRDGSVGDDCYDSVELDAYPESGVVTTEPFAPGVINPAAEETWYDGTDQNCDAWSDYDQDLDGYNLDGECDDTNAAIYPNPDVEEIWYNDSDENCDGNLYDKDLDGHASAAYGGDDCWDDFEVTPSGYDVINGYRQPASDQVNPDADDQPYDGVDADCAGDSDFDFDDDGDASDRFPDRSGVTGLDCDDADSSIYPDAPDTWYDDTDSDCAGNSDWDADYDGYDSDRLSTGTDCDDASAIINPAPTTNEDCGTTDDDNCDGSLDLQNATDCDVFYLDTDGDTYGATTSQCWCNAQVATNYDALNDDDCNDGVAVINPAATEICDSSNTDEDCDGTADNNDSSAASSGKTTFYHDDDRDNYGDSSHSGAAYCDNPTTGSQTWVTDRTDCDDASDADYPGASETVANGDDEDCDGVDSCYTDSDNDNYGTTVVVDGSSLNCTTGTGAPVSTDCDDTDASDYPNATETVANGDDEDCDGVDSCYTDSDNDNYGTTVVVDGSSLNCTTGTGAPVSTDCDDASSSDYPGATETVANGDDEDCDGVDSCYTDSDNDGYGTTVVVDGSTLDCASGTGATVSTDCDDASSSDYPGATETVANGDDEDCDGVDSCYTDSDNDGYGTTVVVDGSTLDCVSGTGAAVSTDCDDASSSDYPGATETVANGDDEDCDGVDSCYTDSDNDGYGTTVVVDGSTLDCVSGTGAAVSTDCDDASSSDYPGATETVANGDDEDCDGVDSCYTDSDNDGYGTTVVVDGSTLDCVSGTGAAVSTDCDDASSSDYPGATETVANNDDEDCDGFDSCYQDSDNDNYGTATVVDGSTTNCTTGTGAPVTGDCDDASASVYPTAADATNGNLIDNDCDGFYDEDGIGDGDIVITEYFVAGAVSYEWVEIYNNSGVDLNLASWTFSVCTDPTTNETLPYDCFTDGDTDTDSFALPSLVISAGGYAVICEDDTKFAGGECDVEWSLSSIASIANENGGFAIAMSSVEVDAISFWTTAGEDWPSDNNYSVQLSSDQLTALASITNDDWSTDGTTDNIWCVSESAYDWAVSETHYGTPADANGDCTP